MRKLLFLLMCWPSLALAGGPKSTFPDPRGMDAEMQNIYHDIANPIINYAQISSETVTFSSITKANIGTLVVGTLSPAISSVPVNSCGYILGTVVQSSQTTSAAALTTSGTGFNLTPTSGTITPKCSTDQILVTVSGVAQATITTGHNTQVSIFRGATDLSGGRSFQTISGSITGVIYMKSDFSYLDSPASTSPLSYDVEIKSSSAGEGVWNPDVNVMTMRLDEIAK